MNAPATLVQLLIAKELLKKCELLKIIFSLALKHNNARRATPAMSRYTIHNLNQKKGEYTQFKYSDF